MHDHIDDRHDDGIGVVDDQDGIDRATNTTIE